MEDLGFRPGSGKKSVARARATALTHVAFDLPQIKRKRFAQQKLYSLLGESDFTRQAVELVTQSVFPIRCRAVSKLRRDDPL